MDGNEPGFRPESIRNLLEREHLTPIEFAKRMGISRQLVAGWLQGIITPQIKSLARMCAEFHVDLVYFFDQPREVGHGKS